MKASSFTLPLVAALVAVINVAPAHDRPLVGEALNPLNLHQRAVVSQAEFAAIVLDQGEQNKKEEDADKDDEKDDDKDDEKDDDKDDEKDDDKDDEKDDDKDDEKDDDKDDEKDDDKDDEKEDAAKDGKKK